MLRAIYTFNDKYIVTGTVRRDGFSGFGKNHKFGVFPSAALAWRISEEDFFKNNVDWMENLKLRLSYGQNGNRTVGRYQTMAQMGAGVGSVKVDDSTVNAGYLFGDGVSAEQMQWIKSLANADLKWETTNTFNIAADFSALNSRIFGTVEYYTSQTNNLLFNINIPQMNGLDKIPSNIGKMSNKGFEMTVTGIPIETKDFSWDVTFNFSRNRNKVKSILGIDADGDGREDDLISDKIFINHPYGVCYDYNIIGMWQIADKQNGLIPDGFEYGTYKVEDVNNDGKYTADKDRKIIGYSDPAYRFKLNKKVKILARKSALSYKAQENSIVMLEDFTFEAPKTKEFLSVLKNLKIEGKKVLFVLPESNKNVYLSARNLQRSEVILASNVNSYKILNADVVVITEKSLETIDQILTK